MRINLFILHKQYIKFKITNTRTYVYYSHPQNYSIPIQQARLHHLLMESNCES